MQAHRLEMKIPQNGRLQLSALPFQPGEVVEIIILPVKKTVSSQNNFPLKDTIVKYDNPTEPVAAEDWNLDGKILDYPHVKKA